MTDTVRERLLEAIRDSFEGVVSGQPAGDPYLFAWDMVTREPPGAKVTGKRHVLGVFDPSETPTPRVGYFEEQLRVVLEFWVHAGRSEEPSPKINEVLGQVQRRAAEDVVLDGRTYHLEEVGSEVDVAGPDDRTLRGAVFYDVTYKHDEDDPRALR